MRIGRACSFPTERRDHDEADVGPILRRFLTRAPDFFDGLEGLTLFKKLVRRQVPERAVRPLLIIVKPPGFDDVWGLGE